ncbi:MAG: lysozyme inhibitor LprI family protein [Pseudomonadota bacterium]
MAKLQDVVALVLASAFGMTAFPAIAQHMNAKDAPCRAAATTAQAAACFARAHQDQELVLAKLLNRIRPAVEGDELSLLDRAQTAWLQYRRLSCDAEYAMYGGGTGGPVTRAACLEAFTRDRIVQLHKVYDWRVEKRERSVSHPQSG